MKKALLTLLLLTIVILTFSFSISYYFLNLNKSGNLSKSSFRKRIISEPFLRKIFKLHQIGDARYDFATDKNYKKLNVIVYYQYGEILNTETIEDAVLEFKQIIKKPNGITIKKIPLTTSVPDYITDEELNSLIKKYPIKWQLFGDTATIQIFILKKYEQSTYLGIVKESNNIFVFKDSIKDVSTYQSSTKRAEVETILHELAHLLGSDHVLEEGCILFGRVENIIGGFPATINTTYCPSDIQEIKSSLSF